MIIRLTSPLMICASLVSGLALAAEPAKDLEPVQVTLTRDALAVDAVPASVSVISGEELRARGANDLRTALSLVAGVEGTPTGDGGPAGSVPALWGLREVDAFLLVIDGVPAGGAFNPQTVQVDLTGVERIEIVRGAAPVTYGTTSFNGVIHIIHYAAGDAPSRVTVGAGSRGSYLASVTASLPSVGDYKQSLTANVERRDFSVQRQDYERYHLLYRGASESGFHVDADISIVPQTPGSATFRTGSRLRTDLVPDDANHNPADGELDQNRYYLALGYNTRFGDTEWATTAAFTRTDDDIIRGFHEANESDRAHGYTQDRQITDFYFDSHLIQPFGDVNVSYGVDYLYGKGEQESFRFPYRVGLDGSNPQSSAEAIAACVPDEPEECVALESQVKRHYLGAYTQADWHITPSFNVLAGLRLNYTKERHEGEERGDEIDDEEEFEAERDDHTRLSGVIGARWQLWQEGANSLNFYADYRNTFKPLAVDFGPEAEVDILRPETSQSYEVGAKGYLADGRFSYDLSFFRFDFKNMRTLDTTGNVVNAGQSRFKGGEIEMRYELDPNYQLVSHYAYHDSRFVHFNRDGTPDGVVDGNRVELAPEHLAGLGLLFLPEQGFNASFIANYVGSRKLNKSNSAEATEYVTLDASIGYSFKGGYRLQVNGYNLTDRRSAIAESELSEELAEASSYYLLPSRSIIASLSVDF